MSLYKNIKVSEVPCLLKASFECNNGDIAEAALDLDVIDAILGIQKMRSLLNSKSRKKETRWSRGRNYRGILESILIQRATEAPHTGDEDSYEKGGAE